MEPKTVEEILTHMISDAKGAARDNLESLKPMIEADDDEARRLVLDLWKHTKATCKAWERVIRYAISERIRRADHADEESEQGNTSRGTQETGS